MSDITFNADAALAKLGELVAKHGPAAVDVAAQVVQINAVGKLVIGGAALAITAVLLVVFARSLSAFVSSNRAWKVWLYSDRTNRDEEPNTEAPFVVALTSGIALIPAAITTTTCLLDVWAWVALINPKLALAHTILTKVGF